MNEKMCNEMAGTLDKVKDIVLNNMFREDHDTSDGSQMKTRAHQIKKIIDYLKLFSEVNTELIITEKTKTKKTHRYPISRNFIEATECMNEILQFFKQIKVISLSEIVPSKEVELRNMYDHFYEIPTEV